MQTRRKFLQGSATAASTALAGFKRQLYAGRSIASDLARVGYVVAVIDMFYWGERRMLLADNAADWRDRPASLTAERIAAFDRRAGESEQLVGRSIESAGFTWPGVMLWDDIRTLDYLARRPESTRAGSAAWDSPSARCARSTWPRSTIASRRRWSWAG